MVNTTFLHNAKYARLWHTLSAAIAIASLSLQAAILLHKRFAKHEYASAINFFSYFTVQSNIMVAAVAVSLAINSNRDGIWRVARLTSLVCISVTGIVYHFVLAPLNNLKGLEAVADTGLHYATPFLAAAGWILFGPRPRITMQIVRDSLIFPVTWCAYTVTRGALIPNHWYPYPFIDVVKHGYLRVGINIAGVAVVLTMFSLAYKWLDSKLKPSLLPIVE